MKKYYKGVGVVIGLDGEICVELDVLNHPKEGGDVVCGYDRIGSVQKVRGQHCDVNITDQYFINHHGKELHEKLLKHHIYK